MVTEVGNGVTVFTRKLLLRILARDPNLGTNKEASGKITIGQDPLLTVPLHPWESSRGEAAHLRADV